MIRTQAERRAAMSAVKTGPAGPPGNRVLGLIPVLLLGLGVLACGLLQDGVVPGSSGSEGSPGSEESQGPAQEGETGGERAIASKGVAPGYDGAYKPVGFVNQGTLNAAVMPCTWVPLDSDEPAPVPSASTVATNPAGPGLWPNPSRFLSLPLGTYTWCIQYEDGDLDDDGLIDYFYFIDRREVTLGPDDRDELEFAREVNFTAPPGTGLETFSGTCAQAPQCALGGVTAYHVADPVQLESAAGDGFEYDLASITVFIDPQATSWIAWNNTPDVRLARESRPGEAFLGPGGFGTDDYIALTIAGPDGGMMTVELDQNDARGRWEGPQNVVYGDSQAAPDVFRQHPAFADPPSQEFFIDEGGSHTAAFTAPGDYTFTFSFRNRFTGSASHPDTWLLVSAP
jgi:hypothetical protein